MRILVTGGAGFIGSAVVRQAVERGFEVFNVDKLTYAANLASLASVAASPAYRFAQADVCDATDMRRILAEFEPDAVMHLAAESHVDRSIDAPAAFVQTNLVGTATILDAALEYWRGLPEPRRELFRFHHISTDEVFGSLGTDGCFDRTTPYDPRSPYSATKAGADHLVSAWRHTYGLPTIVSNCSNNYGPYQFPEKLIPLMIITGLAGRSLPVYGRGEHVRDWLFVEDHASALLEVVETGTPGVTYLVGGNAERANIDVVRTICRILDDRAPLADGKPHEELITFVADRPGHDRRYAIDASDTRAELGWVPTVTFEEGLAATVEWYLARRDWWEPLVERADALRRRGLGIEGEYGT